ncbi:MAG: DNA translocase FtsK 4TM domain-containing protein, partial [Candidatus Tectomicrobia bacterium]|nr:DNA translocase FtsK 4TM domain-containing protein [Candidatus Tectomicrobia bacterium]
MSKGIRVKSYENVDGHHRRSWRRRREVTGFLCFVVGIFLFMILISFHAGDPSIGEYFSSNMAVENYGGIVGARLAGLLVNLLGGAAALLPVFSLFGAIRFWSRPGGGVLILVVSSLGLLVAIDAFFHLRFPGDPVFRSGFESGGIVGSLLGRFVLTLFGRPGSYLLVLAAGFLSFMGVTGLSFRSLGLGFLRLASYFRQVARAIREKRKKKKAREPRPQASPLSAASGGP